MIRVDSVTKRFGSLVAVDSVSFALGQNEIVGFVGPNGAGKSTLLKIISTYLYPTAGSVQVAGVDAIRRPLEVRRRIGYLPGDTPLYQEMRTDAFLSFVASAHGLRGREKEGRIAWVVQACGLADALGKRIKECSTGYRKRIGLAAALVHDPQVIILDEPTHGLDPLQVVAFRDLVRSLRPNRTILLSSHIISEVAQLADRLLLIHSGRLLAAGTIADIARAEGLDGQDLEAIFLHLVRKSGLRSAREQSLAR
jgi:ABC-2 type transport system ATP-binding protein